jgi:hypothetical protein
MSGPTLVDPPVAASDPSAPSTPRTLLARVASRPVLAAFLVAALLHVLWWALLANSGGDIAAQDAWAEFARAHPGSAYNLAWYGGMHPVSYSILSPYLMALVGVRTTMIVAGTVSAALLALLLVRSGALRQPLWAALYGAVALTGNAVSGRVTFGLGAMFALAAAAVVFAWVPHAARRDPVDTVGSLGWRRSALAGTLAALATASSPLAGLFLGIVAAALWLQRRHRTAYALGLPPVAVVVLSAWLFPFSGEQPMPAGSVVLPFLAGVVGALVAPRSWRTMRIACAVYAAAVVVVWLVPSPVGSNVTRMGLLFGGVLLVALATARQPLSHPLPRVERVLPVSFVLAVSIVASSSWQVATAALDAVGTRPNEAWNTDVRPLLIQLGSRHASLGRTEVVPTSSHREAAAIAPYVNLARGWNRQADAERNPLFYSDSPLTPASYHEWLDRWAVHFVVLSNGSPDLHAVEEAAMVAGGLSFLHEVWSDANWRLFEVTAPSPLADEPATVIRFDEAGIVLSLPRAADVVVRIPASPWLSLVDEDGRPLTTSSAPGTEPDAAETAELLGCLDSLTGLPQPDGSAGDSWTVLHAPHAGTYRIAAPYKLPRGSACPGPGDDDTP